MRDPYPVPAVTPNAAEPREQAAQGPMPDAVPVTAGQRASAMRIDSPAEAEGRRTLSTAFVRIGPDGYLTVELRDGRTLVLRDVVMNARDYCGTRVPADAAERYCGSYADVAAARPGGAPIPDEVDPMVSRRAEPMRAPDRP